MINKKKALVEIIIVLILFIWYTIQILIPELKKEFGSSDKFINTNSYQSMIELNIDSNVNFSIIINNQDKISNIIFLNKESTCLYNQNIENLELKDSLNKIIKLLIENDYLKKLSTITITRYSDTSYNIIKKELYDTFKKYDLELSVIEYEKKIEEKRDELGISGDTIDEILTELDFYSKSISGIGKNKVGE